MGCAWLASCFVLPALVSLAPFLFRTHLKAMQEAKKQASKTKPAKLTRAQIQEGLDTIPIEVLLSSGRGKEPQLTHKQKEFARAIALGSTKAQAYREAYKEDAKPSTIVSAPYVLARDSRIQQEIEAYKLALEAEKHRTPAQLKALLVQQLVQHSLNEDFPPAQRVQCLKLIGSLFDVGAFLERKEVTTVNRSEDIRARLLTVLGSQAQDIEAKTISTQDDSAASLLEELQAAPMESGQLGAPTTGASPQNGLMPRDSTTHTVMHSESNPKSNEPHPHESQPDDFDRL